MTENTHYVRADIHSCHIHKAPIPLTRHVGKNVYAIVLENLHAFIVALGRIYVAHADSIRP